MMSTETEATGYEGWAAEVARRASGMEGVTRAEVESVLGSGWREVYEAGETLESLHKVTVKIRINIIHNVYTFIRIRFNNNLIKPDVTSFLFQSSN